MKHYLLTTIAALILAGTTFTACSDYMNEPDMPAGGTTGGRAYGDKSPVVMVYYEINDTNPLNALSYELADGSKFIDIVQLFACNIHRDRNGDPTIWFNPELAPLMADAATYIKPIQAAGIKVILTVLGDWQGIGVGNLTADQSHKFAAILTHIVAKYDLDGIGFSDSYANYNTALVPGSYGTLLKKLRASFDAKFPHEHKLLHVFQWGNTGSSQIDAQAGALLDHIDHGSYGPTIFSAASSIRGVTDDRYMPIAINMGSQYTLYLTTLKNNARRTVIGGYGGVIGMFNVRKHSEVDPQPVYNALAEGAFESTVTWTGVEYAQDWTFIPGGHEITYADVPVGCDCDCTCSCCN